MVGNIVVLHVDISHALHLLNEIIIIATHSTCYILSENLVYPFTLDLRV